MRGQPRPRWHRRPPGSGPGPAGRARRSPEPTGASSAPPAPRHRAAGQHSPERRKQTRDGKKLPPKLASSSSAKTGWTSPAPQPRAVGPTLRGTPQGDGESTRNLLTRAGMVPTPPLPLLRPPTWVAGAARWVRHQEQLLEERALARMGRREGQHGQERAGAAPRGAGTGRDGQERAGAAPGGDGAGRDGQERGTAAPRAAGTGRDGQERAGAAPGGDGTGQDGQERGAAVGTGQDGQERAGAAPGGAGTGRDGQERGAAAPGGAAGTGQDGQERAGAAPGGDGTGRDGQERAGSSPGMHKVLSMDATLAPRDPRAPGQFGHPVAVPDDKQEEAKSRWKEGNFNVYLSDLIPVDRAIADTRPAGCSEQQVHDDLPTTSIIMCFVDEVWSTLLRSVHSVLSRSPPHLIEEIILVDDFSTKEYLREQLDTYMSRFPKVRILRLRERHGLIRARLAGAEIAKGAVLTFLDSHVECNVGWLEPLLDRVRLRRTKVACPVIEVISDKDMSYMTVDNFQRGIFTWPMNFGWRQIPQEVIEKNKIKETDIIRCPVMAGGLFSIDKQYFFELGMYDPGLDVWGGENMEISFKVWMCGGEIEIVPCSRVGHIFRNDNPYSFPKDRVRTVERNLARVAEVWLDEYKELFYGHAYHLLLGNVDVGDLSQQIQLRKKLRCKSFRWYLENVYPDLEAPLVKGSGLLVNAALAGCIAVEGTSLAFEECDVNSTNQQFNYTWLRLIQHGELCLAPSGVVGAVGLRRCQPRSRSLAWLHRSLATVQPGLTEHIISEHQHLPQPCLEVDPSYRALRLKACDPTNPHQKWHFGRYHAD
ncbi:polypeptide N-acetylgalactosaminyltransferase 5 [Poecile atricapillus]|uniref:polypeptide N-acetylgalactosaminyltransferase 5 n=1 Tax=Poecile atricapillus TaxID=48891 RepID=UPI0027386337|nr:polypeptide N-acetylgalactosaminyltransferase 5 [Poecile atricapillus]